MPKIVCCFTGHRPQNLPFGFDEQDMRCVALKEKLHDGIVEQIDGEGVRHFLTGLALGVDTFAAEIVLEWKASYPSLTLQGVKPCRDQAIRWNREQRERYERLEGMCDLLTTLQDAYTTGCMQRRNQYLVDHADCVLAVWDGRPGGTANTVRYAREQGKTIAILDPISLIVRMEGAKEP